MPTSCSTPRTRAWCCSSRCSRSATRCPSLRIVLDHLPNFEPTPAERPAYDARSRNSPSGRRSTSSSRRSSAGSTEGLDRPQQLPRAAGSARRHVRRGSHPVRKRLAQQRRRRADRSGLQIAKEYFATKPRAVAEKYFWKNFDCRVQVGETGSRAAVAVNWTSYDAEAQRRRGLTPQRNARSLREASASSRRTFDCAPSAPP